MQNIPIQALPSQTFTYVDPENNQWNISVQLVIAQMAFSFTLNGTPLIKNVTAVAGIRIIPYDYLENGNFVIITQSQQVPDYRQFGTTQHLLFLEAADIKAFRQPIRDLIRVVPTSFDPNGGLPLRFAPQGYVSA